MLTSLRSRLETFRYALAIVAVGATLGCSDDDSSENEGKVTGTYRGPFTGTLDGAPNSGDLTWKVTQTADKVEGTYSSSDGSSGTIFAVISEGSSAAELVISGEIDETQPCQSSFIIGGTVTSGTNHLKGSYNGNVCQTLKGLQVDFELNRQ